MPRLLNMLMGRAALLMADIDDTASGLEFEKQFTGDDPDDSDTPGANNDGTQKIGDEGAAAPATPAPAPAPAAAPPAGTETGADPVDDPAAASVAAPVAAPAVPAAVVDLMAPPVAAPAPAADGFKPWTAPAAELPRAAPADAAALITAAAEERKTALQRFTDGDIDEATYREVQERTIATESDLRGKVATDEAMARFQHQQKMERYGQFEADTINDLQRAGIPATEENVAEFTALVGYYGQRAGVLGMVDGPNLVASKWALDQAARIFKIEKGIAPTAAPAAPASAPVIAATAAPAVPTKAQAEAERAIDRSKLPPSLAQAPLAADASVGNNDRFAAVDALEGVAQEKAIAVMSPAELAAYLDR